MNEIVELLKPLLNVVWLLVPAAFTSVMSYWLRPKFSGLGSLHRAQDGNHYRFGIHYLDDAPLRGAVVIELTLLGGGKVFGIPDLLAGPEGEGISISPTESGKQKYTFELPSVRPRSAWILTCRTDGKEVNVEVAVVSPRVAKIRAQAVQPHSRSIEKEASLRDLVWLFGTLGAACVVYAAIALAPERLSQAVAEKNLFPQADLPIQWELVPGALGVLAIIAVYFVCMPRSRLPLSQGYLGWERKDNKQDQGK